MKRILTYTILLVSFIQIKTIEADAQASGDFQILNSSLYREKLYLFTDRNLYASGEKVSFRLYNLSHPLLKESNWSRVFYLELINSRNTAVARGKYQVYSCEATDRSSYPIQPAPVITISGPIPAGCVIIHHLNIFIFLLQSSIPARSGQRICQQEAKEQD